MLIPQFSIRTLLALTALAAVASLVVTFAMRGELWALAISAAVASLAAAFLLYAATFLLVWTLATLLARLQPANLPPRAGNESATPAQPEGGSR